MVVEKFFSAALATPTWSFGKLPDIFPPVSKNFGCRSTTWIAQTKCWVLIIHSEDDTTIPVGLCNKLYSMATRSGKTNVGCGRVKLDKQYGYGHHGLWQSERLWESPSGLTPGLVNTFWKNGESSDEYYFYSKQTYWGPTPNSSFDQVEDGSRQEETAAKDKKQVVALTVMPKTAVENPDQIAA